MSNMTQASTGRICLKLPVAGENLLRESAAKKYGLKKGSLQRYVLYCLHMTTKMEAILDKNISTKKQVHGIIKHEIDAYFKPTQK